MSKDTIPPTPFPTQAEILRFVMNAFDIKKDKKKAHEYVRQGDTSGYDIRDTIIDKAIYPALANAIDSELADYIQVFLKQALDNYLPDVIDQGLDFSFVQRKDSFPFLAQEIGSMTLLLFFSGKSLSEQERGLLLRLKDGESLFESVIQQLSNNICWQNCYDGLRKEDKDKILSWRQGKSVPALQSIKLIFNKPEQKKFKRLFLLTRVIEFIRKSKVGRIALDVAIYKWKREQYDPYPDPRSYAPDMSGIKVKKEELLHKLFDPEEPKDKNSLRDAINKFGQNVFSQGLDVYGLFELYMFEAQWHVLAGENKKALAYYKQAFDHALYRVGNQQLSIIKRALCVAAKEKDMPFLKRLKNQAIVFSMYNPPFQQGSLDIKVNNKRTRSNIVEDWEIQWWRNDFDSLFPKQIFFDKYSGDDTEAAFPLGMTIDKEDKIEPDYRHLNRNITIKVVGRSKKEPQLVWFITTRNYEVVKKLLKKGASVDTYSDTGDTPLLMSVIQMSKDKLDFVGEPDDRFFALLSKYKHKPETVNRRTSKRRLSPLISAIDTGRLDVVQKLLEMGAEVDRKASADDITPLYCCIGLLNRLRNPKDFVEKTHRQVITPEVMKEMRRFMGMDYTGGRIPLLMDDKTMLSRAIPDIDAQVIEDMAYLLLKHGANPNYAHNITGSDVTSYTPLMLAAEDDEAQLFEYMLAHGGDIEKRAKYSQTSQTRSLKEICKYFKSKKCLEFLETNT